MGPWSTSPLAARLAAQAFKLNWLDGLVRIEGEAAGQVAVGVGLGEEVVGPSLERGDRVGAGGEAQRRLRLTCEVDQRVGELRRITALLPVYALPGGDCLFGPLGVVLDRGGGVLGRVRREQLGSMPCRRPATKERRITR
jgi:hypothetical protein